ncbi:MAG TPA: ATP-dependent helicase [Acidimicrobiia bacterium]|nr:ATP-dependent helicase [Acidimicrobiia bacterium]
MNGPNVRNTRDALLDDLDELQLAAVTSSAAPLAIIAPAGSGKTRVLTRRIAYGAREERVEARHVLAVTFTRKAAGELVSRIGRLGVDGRITAGTFHAIALAQLRRHANERNREAPRVLERKARLLAPLMGERGAASTVAVADVAAEIEWAKARLIPPDRYEAAAEAAGRRTPRGAGEVSRLYARYEAEKRRRHVIDFDDVLSFCAEAIARDEEFAAGQRWRFRHLFVDEFQDATPLQLRLLRAWLGGSDQLTVVGDPAQAIYGFTGADAAPLIEFARAFPGGQTIALGRNYRSTPGVVALAEVALGSAAGGARIRPEAIRADGAAPTITSYSDDDAEATAIAEACWERHAAGVPWHKMAVLFRTNAQSSRFEAAFTRRGVPFRIGEGQRFAARPPVRVLLDQLREAERKSPGRAFAQQLADLAADDEADSPAEPTRSEADRMAADEARSYRDALLELGRDYLEAVGGTGGVGEFTTWLDTATGGVTGGEAAGTPGVDLVTFHRAKGLEWTVAFVTGLERGLVPISWSTSEAAQTEERRLLHVALSRAEDELHCSWAQARATGTRRGPREPSPWLGLLENEANHAPHGLLQERRAPRDHLAELRDTLAAASPPSPPPARARRLQRGGEPRPE